MITKNQKVMRNRVKDSIDVGIENFKSIQEEIKSLYYEKMEMPKSKLAYNAAIDDFINRNGGY